jgi:hypothetical protein
MSDRPKADFEESGADLASSTEPQTSQNLKFDRADWVSFRTVEGLQQKAGVAKEKLRQLVLKELADNGLDDGGAVRIGQFSPTAFVGDGYIIESDGHGIDGTPEEIARLFSIARPMVSTKLLRLPTRGALGNGLRVVAGSVLASGGSLAVTTRNRRIVLRPEHDGSTSVVSVEAADFPVGTRIEIAFGSAIPRHGDPLFWVEIACRLRVGGQTYLGKSSPHWYDTTQFHELLSASGPLPVRELITHFDGCTGAKAGEIVAAAQLDRALCKDITREQAHRLLVAARENAKPVVAKRLGNIGPKPGLGENYVCTTGTAEFGSDEPFAEVPFVVEAWVDELDDDAETTLTACVNRTPITGDVHASRDSKDIDFFGCGLANTIAKAPKTKQFEIWLNITTPYMPITSDGKAPNLKPFLTKIADAVGKAVKKATRPSAGSGLSQKSVILDHLDDVIATVSGDGEFQFNHRQLFYALRPIVMEDMEKELQLGNFTAIITDYEAENGDIPGAYHEPRGTLYHPHRSETIPVGTLMVESYERPVWTFNKLLYIEKEGFSEALKAVGWPEQHDCAVISSKGFTTRAVRDLVDKLAEHDEPVTVFCAHDADGAGGLIYQTFQEATKARVARKIKIVNLGLEPWEAIEMGLEVETLKRGERRKPVADYVREHKGRDWEEWLQTHRIELNAMTTPQLIEWLDEKLAPYEGKLIPPNDVLTTELTERIEEKVRAVTSERILREAGFERQVAKAIAKIKMPNAAALVKGIKQLFKQEPDREWRDHIEAIAKKAI